MKIAIKRTLIMVLMILMVITLVPNAGGISSAYAADNQLSGSVLASKLTLMGDYALTDDTTIYIDTSAIIGSIDVKGYTLTIEGNGEDILSLYGKGIEGYQGNVVLNSGRLEVDSATGDGNWIAAVDLTLGGFTMNGGNTMPGPGGFGPRGFLTDEEFVAQWQAVPYQRLGFRKDDPEYYTQRGERVRSKSEILIADALYRHNIPYRYEYPLYVDGVLVAAPDFNCLNVRLRKEHYWEHLGMMGDKDYVNHNVKKLERYSLAKDFDDSGLILTFESESQPINIRVIEEEIRKYLL